MLVAFKKKGPDVRDNISVAMAGMRKGQKKSTYAAISGSSSRSLGSTSPGVLSESRPNCASLTPVATSLVAQELVPGELPPPLRGRHN
jgi:hypothetical protein